MPFLYTVNALFPLANKKAALAYGSAEHGSGGNPNTGRKKAEAERHQQPPQRQDVR